MDLNTMQVFVLYIAVPLLFLGITIAIAQYLIRYGIKYYFKMKAMNETKTRDGRNEQ